MTWTSSRLARSGAQELALLCNRSLRANWLCKLLQCPVLFMVLMGAVRRS